MTDEQILKDVKDGTCLLWCREDVVDTVESNFDPDITLSEDEIYWLFQRMNSNDWLNETIRSCMSDYISEALKERGEE
jgi:hypothetical protein